MCDWRKTKLSISTTCAVVGLLAGCADVKYAYNIPESQTDCPSDTIYRSGGTGIKDRDAGTGIKDRNGQDVTSYCEVQVCPGGEIPAGDPGMVWHQEDHKKVLGIGVCPP